MAHTPPANAWRAVDRTGTANPNWPLVILSDELHGTDPLTGDNVVAVVNDGHKVRAALIAAAPDLLAACETALDHCEYSHVRQILRAAIAKATP